jgi:hypothetical protein
LFTPVYSSFIVPQCRHRNATLGGPEYTSSTSHANDGIMRLNVLCDASKVDRTGQ